MTTIKLGMRKGRRYKIRLINGLKKQEDSHGRLYSLGPEVLMMYHEKDCALCTEDHFIFGIRRDSIMIVKDLEKDLIIYDTRTPKK